MDAKITKKRLGHMLSYDWLKIIGAAAAGILIWSLVFTVTATRIRPSQKFTVFNYTSNMSLNSSGFYNARNDILGKGVFSAEVIETGEYDLATTADMASTLLETRLATDECNVMFIANVPDPQSGKKDETTGETTYQTYLERFAGGGFGYYMSDVVLENENNYFQTAEFYLSNFYTDWKDESTLDETKVENAFLVRAKENKDKRFKTAEEKKRGIEQDIERIKKYRDALESFYGYLDAGYVSITELEVEISVGYNQTEKVKRSAVNLCPNEATMGELKKIVHYEASETDGDGKVTKSWTTAKDMHLILFDLKGVEDGFQFESLLFTENLISYVLENTK